VTFDIAPKVPYRIVQEPGRLTLTLEADALDAKLLPPKASTVATVLQVVEPASIVIAQPQPLGPYRATEVPSTGNTLRVVVDLLPPATEPTASAEPARPPAADPTTPMPSFGDVPSASLRTIVIDPGHGGSDEGAKGAGDTREKTITLSVARRLKATIEARLGVRVLLTRDRDEEVRVDERAAVANNNKADLFLSLHVNTSPQPKVEGAEVYHLSLDEYGEEARRLALEPAEVLPVFGGGTRSIDVVQWDLAQARHLARSEQFALLLDEELRQRVPMSPRGIQRAPLRVLVGANTSAALVEMGFVTNPEQERQLRSDEFQGRIVLALYNAILRFRDAPAPAAAPVAGSGGAAPAQPPVGAPR
jgi:N-acetylmuramoyl-L-alanine amidase